MTWIYTFDRIQGLALAPGMQSRTQRLAGADEAARRFGELRGNLEVRVQETMRIQVDANTAQIATAVQPILAAMIRQIGQSLSLQTDQLRADWGERASNELGQNW